MKVICITNVKTKLKRAAAVSAVWLFLFLLGSYLIDHIMLYSVSIYPHIEFSYPYGLVVDEILYNEIYDDPNAITVYCPSQPRTVQFANYQSVEGKFSFDYPSAFELEPISFQGGDILYHIAFSDTKNIANGFVQVWNLHEELYVFLEKSLKTSQRKFKNFNGKKIWQSGLEGIYWDYYVAVDNGFVKGSEVFLAKDTKMYRLSYFVSEENWDEDQKKIFVKMVKSFIIH